MFQDEARYKFDHYIQDSEHSNHIVAKVFSEQRATLVDRVFQMGKKFNQRKKTIHIAVELIDRFFLDKHSQTLKEIESMS